MDENIKYYVVKQKALPEVLLKVAQANRLIETKGISVADATEQVGISRSSYYKYKEDIFPFRDNVKGKTITFVLSMDDEPGLLSLVLKKVAEFHANILTIHQTIPVNGVASLTLSVDILPSTGDSSKMIEEIEQLPGVRYLKILSREQERVETMAKIAVLGYGTVGSGVVEVLETNKNSIEKRAGEGIEVKYVLDLRDFPGDPVQEKIVHDVDIIIQDKEIDVVVEVMGGIEPAFTFVKKALEAGKSVCTSNKALVAEHGPELLAMAKERNLNFMFEASVGGGIPIIRPLNQSLTADEITQITGILNGTTNYILTKMSQEGSSYEDVLKEAQDLGYAERNPEADVEGYDTCRKIAILTSLAFGSTVKFEEIQTEGITKISTADFAYAEKLGCVVKLLATSFKKDEKVYAITAPFLIDATHPLYNVNDVLNGIYIHGNVIGDVMFFGAGAGKLPTASAVVADVVDCVKHKGRNVMTLWSYEKLELGSAMEVERTFFVRIKDRAALEKAKEAFHAVQTVTVDGLDDEFGLVTANMTEQAFAQAAAQFDVAGRIRFDKTTI